MDKSFILEMTNALKAEKTRLEAELGSFAKRDNNTLVNYNTSVPDYGTHEDENASEVATFADNLSLEHTLEGKLVDVLRALEKITKGSYGVCKYCEQEIDERRLRARPESGSCVSCKQEQLKKG